MKKLVLIVFAIISFSQLKSQVSIGYYPFQSTLSVTTNTENIFG